MNDTVSLLKETNAGCKSATNAIERIMPHISNPELRSLVQDYNARHATIGEACNKSLRHLGAEEKDPHPVSGAMANMGVSMGAAFNPRDTHLADMLADGCGMGIRQLSKYKNQYEHADSASLKLTDDLIQLEQSFFRDLLPYL